MIKKGIGEYWNNELVILTHSSNISIEGAEIEENCIIEYDDSCVTVYDNPFDCSEVITQKIKEKEFSSQAYDIGKQTVIPISSPNITVIPPSSLEKNDIKIKLNKNNIYKLLISSEYGDVSIKSINLHHSNICTILGNITIDDSKQQDDAPCIETVETECGDIGIYHCIGIESVKTTTGNIEISVNKDVNHIENNYGKTDIRHTRFTQPNSSIKTGYKGIDIRSSVLPAGLSIETKGIVDIKDSDIDIEKIKIKSKTVLLDRNRFIKSK